MDYKIEKKGFLNKLKLDGKKQRSKKLKQEKSLERLLNFFL